MAAKKVNKSTAKKKNMNDEDRISNAKRLQILNELNKEINSLGPRANAPRQPGKPPSPSSQYRGLANVRDALSNSSLRGNTFVSRSAGAKGPKGTGRARGGARGMLGIFGNRVTEN